MARYVLRRLGHAILVLICISVLAFLLVRLVPGDPARILLGPRAPIAAVNALRHELGLDQSVFTQYRTFASGLLHGTFGTSITYRAPVGSIVGPRVFPSLLLLAYSMAVAILLGVPLGVLGATKRNRTADHLVRLIGTVTFAMPSFWLGLLLVLIFSVHLHLFPTSGYGNTFAQHVQSLTLPAFAVGLFVAPLLVRTVRSSVIETLSKEFVDAARARGLSEARVLMKHTLRNSLLAPLTVAGVFVGALLSWNVAVENVFALPGLGTLLVQSVTSRDFPVIQALVVIFGAVVVLANLVTDLLYMLVDPRVRL